jgi:hypothetical protein
MHLSFAEQLVLWLHLAFAVFTIGPVTVAIMTTPRYIRARNLVVVRYLYRTTRIFVLIALGVLIFGIVLGSQTHQLAKPWLTVSMTLFVVALVLLVLIIRDQSRAITALEAAAAQEAAAPAPTTAVAVPGGTDEAAGDTAGEAPAAAAADPAPEPAPAAAPARHVASVERGRLATMGGIVSALWLVILVLMVWH